MIFCKVTVKVFKVSIKIFLFYFNVKSYHVTITHLTSKNLNDI